MDTGNDRGPEERNQEQVRCKRNLVRFIWIVGIIGIICLSLITYRLYDSDVKCKIAWKNGFSGTEILEVPLEDMEAFAENLSFPNTQNVQNLGDREISAGAFG